MKETQKASNSLEWEKNPFCYPQNNEAEEAEAGKSGKDAGENCGGLDFEPDFITDGYPL
ncbi:MAG: hypothetical protein ACOY9Y_06440 [Bacillota bacterium]